MNFKFVGVSFSKRKLNLIENFFVKYYLINLILVDMFEIWREM
jgi:hypothetical protein